MCKQVVAARREMSAVKRSQSLLRAGVYGSNNIMTSNCRRTAIKLISPRRIFAREDRVRPVQCVRTSCLTAYRQPGAMLL